MYDIVGKRNLWFAISAFLTLPGLLFIILGGLRPSIDFTGGTEWEVRYRDEPTAAEMTDTLRGLGYDEVLVVQLADGSWAYRTSHSVPPVKSIEGFRPPMRMKIRPGIVRIALIAKYQLRLPTMSYIDQRST